MLYAVLAAAGDSRRAGGLDKIWVEIGGKPLLWYGLSALVKHPLIREVVVVVRQDDKERLKACLLQWELPQVWVTEGGATRQESVRNGIKKLGKLRDDDRVLVHNAANPFVTEEEITAVIDASDRSGAAAVGHPVVDTLKRIDEHGNVLKTIERRESIWHVQTPQVAPMGALQKAWEKGVQATDELSLVESFLHFPAVVVPASERNRKITTALEVEWARWQIEGTSLRVGMGMDSHRFEREHQGLVLGGKRFESFPKLAANSDGDVALHAVCNALLQASGESGSLGRWADVWCHEEGITDSREYLRRILEQVRARGFIPTQVGVQFEGRVPRIDPLAEELKVSLAALLSLPVSAVGITATSGEDLTPFGRGEGLQCWATVTLRGP